jgi:iron complex outermembrane recepter protein
MKRMPGAVLIILLMSSYFFAKENKGSIQGKVFTRDNLPIPMASIIIKGTSQGTSTDANGNFLITNIDAGFHNILISSVGKETIELSVTVKSNETTQIPVIILKERPIQLQEIRIAGEKNSYKAENVSSSLRIQGKLLDMPQNIQVVTNKMLSDQQIFNMTEGVTRNVSGVSRVEHWDNIYARLYTRGDHIPGYRNGMNIATTWGPLVEDMSIVERVEFVKGPAGFMLANGEPGGFYNVVTKKPTGLTRSNYEISVGSYGTYRASADFDGKLDDEGKLLYRLNVMGQLRNSHVDYDYNDRYLIAPVFKYNFDEKTSLIIEYTYQFSKFLQPAAYVFSGKGYADVPVNFTSYDPNLDPTKINDHSLFVYLNHQLDENWKLTAQLGFFDNEIRGYDVWPGAIDNSGNLSRGLYSWDASNKNKLGQIFINGKIETGEISHNILAGLDMGNKNSIADFGYAGSLPALNIYSPVYGIPLNEIPVYDFSRSLENRHNYSELGVYEALYLQDEIGFFKNQLRLTLAGRYTHSQIDTEPFEDVFTPRIGLSTSVFDATSIYALYDQSFIPQSGENFFGKHFEPVKGTNIELGVKKEWFGGKWNSTVSFYQITKTNVLSSDPAHLNFSVQLGEIKTKGIEVDLVGEILPGLETVLNYALTDSKITNDTDPAIVGNETPGSIKQIQNSWLTYKINNGSLNGIGLSLGYQWQIDRISWYVWDGTSQKLPNYFRIDGGISWQNEKLKCSLVINNLLNEYLYSGFPPTAWYNFYTWISEAPRNFRLSFEYKL